MERIIDVYYGSDCLPYKDEQCTIHFPVCGSVFLGASQTTKIRFHYYNIGNYNNVYIVESKRADGRPSFEKLTKNEEGGYAELSLSGWYSECKGDLYISLKVYMGGAEVFYNDDDPEQPFWDIQGNPVIQSTGAIKLAVNYTPVGQVEHYNDAYGTYQHVLSGLSDRLEIKNGIVAVNSLSSVNISTYDNGQLFFDVDTKNIYKLESGSFVKINNKLEIVDVSGQTYQALLDKYGTQPFMSYFEETNNISVYQFKEITGGYELHCSSQKNGLIHIPSVVLANTFSTSDFTQLDFQSAPVVELQSYSGTLSDLDYEKVLQPNATIKFNNSIFTKTNETSSTLTFGGYVISSGSSTYVISTFIIRIIATTKAYSVNTTEKLCYTNIKIDQLLNAKQDTLDSGTNIKTINNISLLGSGNIVIQGGGNAEWGSIGGNIADQTDLQNEFQNVREIAEGKTNSYVLYSNGTVNPQGTAIYSRYVDGVMTPFSTRQELETWLNNHGNALNSKFNSQDDAVYIAGELGDSLDDYFIVYSSIVRGVSSISINLITLDDIKTLKKDFKHGDNVYIVNLEVPDRWVADSVFISNNDYSLIFGALETQKVNLDNYSTKTETSTEVNKVAHDIAVEYDENTLYGSGDLCIKDKLLYKCNTNNTTGTWDSTKWDLTTVNSELGIIKGNYVDLASTQTISGEKTFTNNVGIQNKTQGVRSWIVQATTWGSFRINDNSGNTYCATYSISGQKRFGPGADATNDLGAQDERWKNLYLSEYIQFSNDSASGSAKWILEEDVYGQFIISRIYNGIKTTYWEFNGTSFQPKSNNANNIGTQAKALKGLFTNEISDSNGNSVSPADMANLIAYAKAQGWIQ